jgi:hypothetical protein
MGMTDLQFKAFVKQVKKRIEDAKKTEDNKLKDEKLEDIIGDMEDILES